MRVVVRVNLLAVGLLHLAGRHPFEVVAVGVEVDARVVLSASVGGRRLEGLLIGVNLILNLYFDRVLTEYFWLVDWCTLLITHSLK